MTVDKVHKALLLRAPKQEIIAVELIAVEEIIAASGTIQSMVDESLMRFQFGRDVSNLPRARWRNQNSRGRRVLASTVGLHVGLYNAMYLQKGNFVFLDDVNPRQSFSI